MNKIELTNSIDQMFGVSGTFITDGNILIDRLLDLKFRNNLSEKDCYKLLDIAIDNLINGDFLSQLMSIEIKKVLPCERFYIDYKKQIITEVK